LRPTKTILLISEDEAQLSILRFTLRNSRPSAFAADYAVTSVSSAPEALETLRTRQYDLLLILCPLGSLSELLHHAKLLYETMPSLVIYSKAIDVMHCSADAMMHNPSTADLLERIRILMIKKRGPSPGCKKKTSGIVAREMAERELKYFSLAHSA